MPNSYFRFRQFTVWQERCAMKVCTDACLFGAWLSSRDITFEKALDIGAGTGLLSLMLAQRCNATIDAVEIDEEASVQAVANFAASPWPDRLAVIAAPVQQYALQTSVRYGLILSNPPFFAGDLNSPDARRNAALHSTTLDLCELFDAVNDMLHPQGYFALMLPFQRETVAAQLAAERGFFVRERLRVKQTDQHTFFRTMYLFCRSSCPMAANELSIKSKYQDYTPAFTELMNDFYLAGHNALR